MVNTSHLYYLLATSFLIYFVISYIYKIVNVNNIEKSLLTEKGLLLINLRHILGIVLFGIMFFLLLPNYRGLITTIEIPGLNILLFLSAVVIISAFISYYSAKKILKKKIEKSRYHIDQGWIYFTIRILFLLSYEFFFRGVLFFSLLEVNDIFIAILVCTFLYVLIHAFDSRAEIIGAIPFGIILCLFSYFTNSIWPAFIIHITLSGVYEVSIFNQLTRKNLKSWKFF